jgi:hypothetical protein
MFDTTAISRAPTAALAYTCIFKRIKDWKDVIKSEEYLKRCHPCGHPNLKIV